MSHIIFPNIYYIPLRILPHLSRTEKLIFQHINNLFVCPYHLFYPLFVQHHIRMTLYMFFVLPDEHLVQLLLSFLVQWLNVQTYFCKNILFYRLWIVLLYLFFYAGHLIRILCHQSLTMFTVAIRTRLSDHLIMWKMVLVLT